MGQIQGRLGADSMQISRLRRTTVILFLIAFLFLAGRPAQANSVLTHEQIVDFLWKTEITKILMERYPKTTPEELTAAHAYAYGGCLIQDLGYYPSGNKFFSDLVHYVRTGDFVSELISQSQNVNELAFALGALSHYSADTVAHPTVNAAVAIVFPKLRRKYGKEVTYEDDPKAHIRTEFGFDVSQVAQNHYTSDAYHDFIGFQVAKELLERAFLATYGISLKEVLPDEDRTINTYRRSVSTWIPRLTQVALISKKKELEATPNFNPRQFRYLLSRTKYEKEWGSNYVRPTGWARFLAFIVKLMPKIGPFRTLDIKVPTPQTEKMYIKSVEDTVTEYRRLLAASITPQFSLPDRDLDTSKPTSAGEYQLADKAYARLMKQLAKDNFAGMNPTLRANILDYYSDTTRPIATKEHPEDWKELQANIEALRKSVPVRDETTSENQKP